MQEMVLLSLLTPEVFVPVVSVALLFTLSVLTVVTQLGPQGIVVLQWLWGAMRWLVPARNAQQPSGPRKPGRRARKTQRRRERLASQKETYPATATQEKECRAPPLVEDAVRDKLHPLIGYARKLRTIMPFYTVHHYGTF